MFQLDGTESFLLCNSNCARHTCMERITKKQRPTGMNKLSSSIGRICDNLCIIFWRNGKPLPANRLSEKWDKHCKCREQGWESTLKSWISTTLDFSQNRKILMVRSSRVEYKITLVWLILLHNSEKSNIKRFNVIEFNDIRDFSELL